MTAKTKLDIVLQGECTSFTRQVIKEYRKLDFVDKIILSTYTDKITFDVSSDIDLVNNEVIEPRGTGNRNLQINTSRNGLARVQSEYCIKMRTDQLIRDMELMYNYWMKRHEDGKIFVMGMYRSFPYHPRDHVFWGRTQDVKNVFDIPFDTDQSMDQDYRYKTRAETYIGQYYYARFDESIKEHIDNPLEFTVDLAPRKNEALTKDFRIRHKVFAPFPRVSMAWPKHGLQEYHYHIGETFTEYWADDN